MNSTTMAPRGIGALHQVGEIAATFSRLGWGVSGAPAHQKAAQRRRNKEREHRNDAVIVREPVGSAEAKGKNTAETSGVRRIELERGGEEQGALVAGCPGKDTTIVGMGSKRYPVEAIRRAVATTMRREYAALSVTLRDANEVAEELGRRIGAVHGHMFSVALRRTADDALVGAAVCAAPTLSHLDDGLTCELRRVAVESTVDDGYARLHRAISREASALGIRRLVAYGSVEEDGAHLYAAGFDLLKGAVLADHGGACEAGARGSDERRQPVWVKVLRGEQRGMRARGDR